MMRFVLRRVIGRVLVSFGIDESLMRIVMSVFELMISIVFVIID